MKIITRSHFAQRSSIVMMPEGPEVRTVVDQLQRGVNMRLLGFQWISGRYVQHGPPDNYEAFMETMTDPASSTDPCDIIQEWNAKGKFIYIILDKGLGWNHSSAANNNKDHDDFQRSIWITLAMSGRFVAESAHKVDPTHARWYMSLLDPETGQVKRIYYHDARNFGTIKFCLSKDMLAKKLQALGPDILDPATKEDDFLRVIAAQRNPSTNVCKFIMNQERICGVGNYILAEGLYRASIDPFASLDELSEDQKRLLFRELQSTAFESYEAQGMTRKGGSYKDVEGNGGKFEFQLQVYGRKFCAKGNPVIHEVEGPHGRTIWYTEAQLFKPRAMRNGNELQKDEAKDARGDAATAATSTKDDPHSDDAVQRLTIGLTDNGWKSALAASVNSPSFQQLAVFLEGERSRGATIYPPEDEVFSALNLCPLEKVKVVILGQDPYHGKGQGHGLAFSVRPGVRIPPSLVNIFKEAKEDVGIDMPSNGYLRSWAEQGVLLLNTVLTVREGEANSHAKKGWEDFTSSIVEILNKEKEDLVFLLWGNPAAKMASGVDESKHTVIRTSHPSPLGATKTNSPFLGSRCFSSANKAIVKAGKDPIDWNVK